MGNNGLISCLFVWILSIRKVVSPCNMQIPHGKVTSECTTQGTWCLYSCQDGYKKNDRVTWLGCSTSGQLVPAFNAYFSINDLCTQITCPKEIEGGFIAESCSTEYNTMCFEYMCYPGYAKQDESFYASCDISGQWINPEGKSLACVKDGELCPGKFHGGYIVLQCNRRQQDRCAFECYPGFSSDRSVTLLTCQEDGLWDVDTNSLCIESDQLTSFVNSTNNSAGNLGTVVWSTVGGVTGMIFITISVVLVRQWSRIRKSQTGGIPAHSGSRCLSQERYPQQYVTNIPENHTTNCNAVLESTVPPSYDNHNVPSFDSMIQAISSPYPGPLPSYTQALLMPKELPPTYEQAVANPSGSNLYV